MRLSTSGASTNVGSSDAPVGDFGMLLLTINPLLDPSGYPDLWTGVSAAVSGFASGTDGRIAFRYFTPDTNTNGNYIGIDSLTISQVPEPASFFCFAAVLAGVAALRRRK